MIGGFMRRIGREADLLRLLSIFVVAALADGAIAQEPEHRPVRPKGRYFTQEQLQRALAEANADPAKTGERQPEQPLSENAKSLVDFAKRNPELAKSLLEAARNLAQSNPDLFKGDDPDAARKVAEELSKQGGLGDLMKKLDQKPPPANVKRKPPGQSDEQGRRPRDKRSNEGDLDRKTPPQDSTQPEPRDFKPEQGSETETPKKPRSALQDLAGQSPDFVRSLLEAAKKKALEGSPPTKEAAEETVDKAVEDLKHDPTIAPWLEDPQTQRKLRSPQLREEVRKEIERGPQPSNRRGNRADGNQTKEDSPPTRDPVDSPPVDSPKNLNRGDGRRKPTAPKNERIDPERSKADESQQDVKKWAESLLNPDKKRSSKEADSSKPSNESSEKGKAKAESNPIADLLKENPGLVESLIKSAGAGEQTGEGKDSLKGVMEALKGTGLEKDFRDLARELNKDGSLNDLLKDFREQESSTGSARSNRRGQESGEAKRSSAAEASKAFKELTGEDINAGSLGETMKSIGEVIKKQTAASEGASGRRSDSSSSSSTGDDLGDGLLGMLGRGAAKVGEWGAQASQKISENVAPNVVSPQMNTPSLGDMMSMPSAETGGKALMLFAIIASLAFGTWLVLRRQGITIAGGPLALRLPKLSLVGLSPREQAAALFERAALERLGEPARPKHHVALAEKLCHGPTTDSRTLAEVYEAARYTPPTEPFQPENVAVVRDVLGRQGKGDRLTDRS
jgi:hypothetical protein